MEGEEDSFPVSLEWSRREGGREGREGGRESREGGRSINYFVEGD